MLEGIAHRTLFPLPPVRGFSKRVAGLQDKQNKSTARTAINGKNRIAGLVGYRAFIYGLSEASEPLLKVATLTGFEPVLLP